MRDVLHWLQFQEKMSQLLKKALAHRTFSLFESHARKNFRRHPPTRRAHQIIFVRRERRFDRRLDFDPLDYKP